MVILRTCFSSHKHYFTPLSDQVQNVILNADTTTVYLLPRHRMQFYVWTWTLLSIFKKSMIIVFYHTLFISFSFRRICFTAEKQFSLCFNSSNCSGCLAVRPHLARSPCHISHNRHRVTLPSRRIAAWKYNSFLNGGGQFRTSVVFTIVHINERTCSCRAEENNYETSYQVGKLAANGIYCASQWAALHSLTSNSFFPADIIYRHHTYRSTLLPYAI
jgi:hypothetical protein